jgi:hypothetical protein
MWLDYTVESAGPNFTIKGDWTGEVMGVGKDGTPKDNYLYKPGDVFVVDENGWLVKTDDLSILMQKYKMKNNK